MNIETLLQMTEELRAALEKIGVTTQGLVIAFVVAGIFFILSLREVISWFMKIPQLRKEIRSQRVQIGEMQRTLEQMRDMLLAQAAAGNIDTEDSIETAAKPAKTEEAPATDKDGNKRFQFDH